MKYSCHVEGVLLTDLPSLVQLPGGGKRINLNNIQIHQRSVYELVFQYLCTLWQLEVNLIPKSGNWRSSEPFVATEVKCFSYVKVNGTRFGACTSSRGKGTSFAFIDGRVAVRISYLLLVKHEQCDSTKPPLSTTLAIVKRFKDDNVPEMPWFSK